MALKRKGEGRGQGGTPKAEKRAVDVRNQRDSFPDVVFVKKGIS
jgi:hypothetical protein